MGGPLRPRRAPHGPEGCAAAPAVRVAVALRAGSHRAAVGRNAQRARARQPQARLLPLDGVPDRPQPPQQHPEPVGGRARAEGPRARRLETRGPHRRGAGRGARQRRSRPPRRVFHRLARDPAVLGDRIRPALRVRHLPPVDQGRVAGRAAGPLAAPSGPLGDHPSGTDLPCAARRLDCARGLRRAHRAEPPVDAARRRVRPSGRRLWRAVRQHAAALGGRRAGVLRLRRVFQRRFRRRRDRQRRGGIPDARPLSGRLDRGGPDAAISAGVLPRQLLAAGRRRPLPAGERDEVVRASRACRDSVERHAPVAVGRRADAHPSRRGEARVGRGLGPHRAHARLHQPHASAGGPREVAGRSLRAAHPAPPRDRLRDQPALSRRRRPALPERRRPRPAHEPDRGGLAADRADGSPGMRRQSQHQRRREDPLRPSAHPGASGFRGDVPRPVQQQDQRRHAPAVAAPGQPAARGARHGRRRRRGLGDGPLAPEGPRSARRRTPLSGRGFAPSNAGQRSGSPSGSGRRPA